MHRLSLDDVFQSEKHELTSMLKLEFDTDPSLDMV
jgi:hypothetical protein